MMRRRFGKSISGILLFVLLLSAAGCGAERYVQMPEKKITARTREEIEEYIREYTGISDIEVDDTSEMMGEDVQDVVWSARQTADPEFSFRVIEVRTFGEIRGTLTTNYGAEMLKYYYETEVEETSQGLIRLAELPHESLSYASSYYLTAEIGSRAQLEIVKLSFQKLLDHYREGHTESLYLSYQYPGKDRLYPDSADLIRRIRLYDLDSSFQVITGLAGEDLQKMDREYIRFCGEFGLLDRMEEFSDEDVEQTFRDYAFGTWWNFRDRTGKVDHIFLPDRGENIYWTELYEVLKDADYPVEGDAYHFSFDGMNGLHYEFSYDFVKDRENDDKEKMQAYFYFLQDGREETGVAGEALLTCDDVYKLTGIRVAAAEKELAEFIENGG